ncbi:MAG: hypothetical protein ACR2FG_04620 [Marmoricola sp.]
MGDIQVAVDDLRALGSRLDTLAGDLKDGDGHADYTTSDLAHSTVVDAMDNFRGNWDDNRDHLADKLNKLGELAKTSADWFTKTDEDLAKKVREALESS